MIPKENSIKDREGEENMHNRELENVCTRAINFIIGVQIEIILLTVVQNGDTPYVYLIRNK